MLCTPGYTLNHKVCDRHENFSLLFKNLHLRQRIQFHFERSFEEHTQRRHLNEKKSHKKDQWKFIACLCSKSIKADFLCKLSAIVRNFDDTIEIFNPKSRNWRYLVRIDFMNENLFFCCLHHMSKKLLKRTAWNEMTSYVTNKRCAMISTERYSWPQKEFVKHNWRRGRSTFFY